MSQVARPKMFDDISSFSDDEHIGVNNAQCNSKPLPITLSAQYVDPAVGVVSAAVSGQRGEINRYDGNDAPREVLVSVSLPPPKSGNTGKEMNEHVTTVARVDILQSPIKNPRSAARPKADVLGTHHPEGTEAHIYLAPAGSATVVKLDDRVGGEAAGSPSWVESGKAGARPDIRNIHAPSATQSPVEERGGVVPTAAGGAIVPPPRSRLYESSHYEMQDQFTPHSVSRVTAVQPEHCRHGGAPSDCVHSSRPAELSNDEAECPLASYIFPRLDPSLAYYDESRSAGTSGNRDGTIPPNVVERICAYLMVADIRVSVYLGALLLSLVMMTISIPTSQLDVGEIGCLTYWGYKNDCDSTSYAWKRAFYPCMKIRDNLGAGAALSIITLIVCLTNLAAVLVVVCCWRETPQHVFSKFRAVVGTLGCVSLITQLISWGVVTIIYETHPCSIERLVYGVGFGFNVAAWMTHLLGLGFFIALPSSFASRYQRRC